MADYRLSWAYMVARMESKFGFAPDDERLLSFWDFGNYLSKIWDEFYEIKRKEELEENDRQRKAD